MIDIQNEKLRLLSQSAREIPGRPHISTVFRWWRHGVKGVKLETVLVGGRRFTSAEAIQRFIQRLSASTPVQRVEEKRHRSKDSQRVDEELDAAGI